MINIANTERYQTLKQCTN